MKEVTIDSVRERIANLELQANYSPIGGRLNEFEIACLRELLELLALREKTRRAVAYLKAVNDRSDPEFKDVLVDYAIRELDGVDHLSAPPAPVVPDEMTPEMMREVQLHSELGAYAAANLSGAYGLFDEFWKVACRAMLKKQPLSVDVLAGALRNARLAPSDNQGRQRAPVAAGWIACSERMPEREYVLAADFSGAYYLPSLPNTQVGIYADWFEDGKPSWDDGDGNDLHLKQVTHWMPLPEAPGKEG